MSGMPDLGRSVLPSAPNTPGWARELAGFTLGEGGAFRHLRRVAP